MAKTIVKVDTRRLRLKLNKVNRESNKAWQKTLPRLIIAFIKKGISPVKGQGRFAKYSSSYLAQIKGEAAFRTGKHGGVYALTVLKNKELKSLRASKDARKENRANKDRIAEMNKEFLSHGKKPTPRNLTLSGKMLSSITSRLKGGALELGFTDEKAEYHNKGGGNLPRRAMLPTESGEEFNNNITLRLREVARKAVLKIFN
jgi:hypothetical protein